MSDYSNEYFFQNDNSHSPWESVVYEDGYAWGERSTLPRRYRKMFCWGSGPGGRRWQDFLSLPGQEYLEVQAGLAPTQLHTADIGGGETVDWVQAFTAFQAETEQAHQTDYLSASKYVDARLTQYLEPGAVQTALEQARSCCGTEAEILETGSGWAYLESRLRNYAIPPGLSFPVESAGADEAPWAELLLKGSLPRRASRWDSRKAVEAGPGSFVIDEAWENLLEARFHITPETGSSGEGDWLSPYHLGIIAFERGETGRAVSCWEESLKKKKNPWACRNLAVAALQSGNALTALVYYERALSLPGGQDQSFIQEFVPLLMDAGREEEAAALLETCIRSAGSLEALALPLIEAAARIALNQGDAAGLDRVFSLEPVHIREGNTVLVDIWTEWEIRKLSEKGISRSEAETHIRTALAEGSLPPPKEIDFRMYTRLR
jgi:tetratricopeptide (TPR) repeat protein